MVLGIWKLYLEMDFLKKRLEHVIRNASTKPIFNNVAAKNPYVRIKASYSSCSKLDYSDPSLNILFQILDLIHQNWNLHLGLPRMRENGTFLLSKQNRNWNIFTGVENKKNWKASLDLRRCMSLQCYTSFDET